jgi:twinkle protein
MTINERHAKIIEARGFDIELLESLGIASSSRLGPDTIAIPIVRGGELYNTKYRTIAGEKRFVLQRSGRRPIFWQVDRISDPTLAHQPLIVTEGEFDTCAAIQSGFGRVSSVPLGAPEKETPLEDESLRYQFIENAPKQLGECKEIILGTDADANGIVLLNDLALRLGRARCKWIKYPPGCKDLADVLQKFGQRGVVEAINRAQWMQIDGLYCMSELPPLPDAEPLDSGFPHLTEHYKLRPGDLTVVTGIPSHGKSTFVLDIVCRMVVRHKWRACIGSFEMTPQLEMKRFLRSWYGASLVIEMSPAQLARADEWIEQNFHFIVPGDDDEVTLEWVLERMSSAVVRHGERLCVLDPWNEIEHDRPPHMTLTEYTGYALRALKRFARKHQVHLIVVAHPKMLHRGTDGAYPMPSLYDISDSAHWYNRPEVGIVVWRGEEKRDPPDSGETIPPVTVVRVAKSRYHDLIGKPGQVKVSFVRERSTFEPTPVTFEPKRKNHRRRKEEQ